MQLMNTNSIDVFRILVQEFLFSSSSSAKKTKFIEFEFVAQVESVDIKTFFGFVEQTNSLGHEGFY